jgi:hypothetical protein
VENISVDWVKRCWVHCITTLQQSHFSDDDDDPSSSPIGGDLLIFANARDNSDVFLAEAGRLSGARKVIMDL